MTVGSKRINLVPRMIASIVTVNLLLLAPWIWWITTGSHLLSVTEPYRHSLLRHFRPDAEANLFTWYSSVLLISAAFAALVNFWLDGRSGHASRWRFAWLGVFFVTMLLSLEEVAQIHEMVQHHVRNWSRAQGGSWAWLAVAGKAWILPYLPLILAVIVFFFWTFCKMFREHSGARMLALCGLSLWIAALVLEFFFIDLGNAWGRWYVELEMLFEEGAEIFGTTAMLVAYVWYGQTRFNELLE